MKGVFDSFWHRWLKRPYTLSFSQIGSGPETVVLLHGVGANRHVWDPMLARLDKQHWRIIVPDLLGFGQSPKPQWKSYTVQDHADAVLAMLRRLRVRGPLVMVGHSMGCLVATHIAATQPALVKRLMLYEPPLYADDPTFRSHIRRKRYYYALYEFIAAHPQLAVMQAHLLWRIVKRIIGFKLTAEEWTPFERSLRNTIMRQTAYRELHDIRIPTDIIHGRFDLIVTRTDLRRMYKANKNIIWHMTTDTHGISARSAKYLAAILTALNTRFYMR